MAIQFQKGDVVDVLGEKFVVLDIQGDNDYLGSDEGPVHDWIERLTLVQLRGERTILEAQA